MLEDLFKSGTKQMRFTTQCLTPEVVTKQEVLLTADKNAIFSVWECSMDFEKPETSSSVKFQAKLQKCKLESRAASNGPYHTGI